MTIYRPIGGDDGPRPGDMNTTRTSTEATKTNGGLALHP